MSLIKRIFIGIVSTLLLLLIAILGVLFTEQGTQWLLREARHVVTGFSFEQSSGNITHLSFKNMVYQQAGFELHIGSAQLIIKPSCFITSKLCIDNLAVADLSLRIDSDKLSEGPQDNSPPITEIKTPVPISLNKLKLDHGRVVVDGVDIAVEHLTTAAKWQGRTISVLPSYVDRLQLLISDSTDQAIPSTTTSPEETLSEIFSQPLRQHLPDIIIPLDILVDEVTFHQASLTLATDAWAITHISVQGSIKNSVIALTSLDLVTEQSRASLTGSLSFNQQWPVNLIIQAHSQTAPFTQESATIQAYGDIAGDLTLTASLAGDVAAQLHADIAFDKPYYPFSFELIGKKSHWPLDDKEMLYFDNLRFNAKGSLHAYTLSLMSDLWSTHAPKGHLQLHGSGDEKQLQWHPLQFDTTQGSFSMIGEITWEQAMAWYTKVTFHDFTTDQWLPSWPMSLQGELSSAGSMQDNDWHIAINDMNITGTLRESPLQLSGSLQGNALQQWRFNQLILAVADNRLQLNGDLAQQWQLDADITITDASQLLPELQGTAQGNLKIRGNAKQPRLTTDLTLSNLFWQNLAVKQLTLKGYSQLTAPYTTQLQLDATQLTQESNVINRLSLQVIGDNTDHTLTLSSIGHPYSGSLALQGRLDHQYRWQGKLSRFTLMTPIGEWHPSQPITLDYQPDHAQLILSPHCWINAQAEACFTQPLIVGKQIQLNLVLKSLTLAIFDRLMPEAITLQGQLQGALSIVKKADESWPNAMLTLKSNEIVAWQTWQTTHFPITLQAVNIEGALHDARLTLATALQMRNGGSFKSHLAIGELATQRTLSGDLQLNQLDLSLLQPLLSKSEQIAGGLQGNLSLAGSLKQPKILGQLWLEQVKFNSHLSPITITEGDIKLKFNGDNSTLSGDIVTKKGTLSLQGKASWDSLEQWRAELAAKGESIRLTLTPTAQLDISPDVNLIATASKLTLNGTIVLPWADIKVKQLPNNAVAVSSDEVILNNQLKPVKKMVPENSMAIESNLQINVGPRVAIDTFGLKALLQGELLVKQQQNGLLGLQGDITLHKGSFRAYGQDLLINKGRIIFSGPPTQPQLNIEAIRNPNAIEDGVTAGLKITGFADAPKLEIYSDPAMSKEQALSYLLRGQSLDKSGNDSSMITSALISLGVAQSGKLVGELGQLFGIHQLSLDTQGVGDKSQVIVSGYLSPHLQIKYGIGIFDSLATLTLRYRLMPRLYLEAISGTDQALDLLYQFSFD